mmetsp:Transcript_3202/g.6211  ORF Transcript_3202/g.6211 Transcript_3202/m.6211 type:complete len:457 (-) Transcript_3202:71-1441(-)
MAQDPARNAVDALVRTLRGCSSFRKLDLASEIDGLERGQPETFLRLLSTILQHQSKHFTQSLVQKGFVLSSKTDAAFLEEASRAVRHQLGYTLKLSRLQILKAGYPIPKAGVLKEISERISVFEYEKQLKQKNRRKSKSLPRVAQPADVAGSPRPERQDSHHRADSPVGLNGELSDYHLLTPSGRSTRSTSDSTDNRSEELVHRRSPREKAVEEYRCLHSMSCLEESGFFQERTSLREESHQSNLGGLGQEEREDRRENVRSNGGEAPILGASFRPSRTTVSPSHPDWDYVERQEGARIAVRRGSIGTTGSSAEQHPSLMESVVEIRNANSMDASNSAFPAFQTHARTAFSTLAHEDSSSNPTYEAIKALTVKLCNLENTIRSETSNISANLIRLEQRLNDVSDRVQTLEEEREDQKGLRASRPHVGEAQSEFRRAILARIGETDQLLTTTNRQSQ